MSVLLILHSSFIHSFSSFVQSVSPDGFCSSLRYRGIIPSESEAFPNRDWREGAPAQPANQKRGVTCLLPGLSGINTSLIRQVEVVALSALGLVRQQPKCSQNG